jgi:hypothetical protein
LIDDKIIKSFKFIKNWFVISEVVAIS